MIYTIDINCIPSDISPSQYFLMLSLIEEPNTIERATDLWEKGLITPLYDRETHALRGFTLTAESREKVVETLSNSMTKDSKDYKDLAVKLKEVFPAGKKDGTSNYWAEGAVLIERRLKQFEKKYGSFSDEAILNAAKKYVEGFNGNYRYMRTLRYFIFREERGAAGDVESKSDLLTYLENAGQEDGLRNDWTTELR